MKVLILDEWFPWPLNSGKKIRTFNLIRRIAKHHEIHFLSYAKIPEENEKIRALEQVGIKAIIVDDKRVMRWSSKYYFAIFKNIFSKKPFSTTYHITKNLINKMLLFIENENPEIIHCEWTNLSPILKYIKRIPTVIVSHNIESQIWQRYAKEVNNPIKAFIARQQSKRIEALERKWYFKASHVIAVSKNDHRIITSYGGKSTIVENGVDLNYFTQQDIIENRHEAKTNSIIFTASFDTFANQDAVKFFINEIFKVLEAKIDNFSVWFVGKDPPKWVDNLKCVSKKIHVTGEVKDVREYISKATLAIVPLRIGGGSRLKILEAMAMKKAVLSTTIGAEGLNVIHGKNIIISDTAEDFANKIIKLLNDNKLRENIANSGFELVRAEYDWDFLAEKLNKVWKSLK